ncbi:LppA family lipoprotein [Nocardia alni]|uniref:LppA family lipoprotein n=1 Tax=Nocardia alni TaxID=2815723 RepID=UPI001C2302D1|nr:LppA family lipoprotein [Nocardia alni]
MTRPAGRSIRAAVATALILATTGCGMFDDNPYQKSDPTKTARAAERLTGLPSLEDTEARLKSAVAELGAYVSSLVPGMNWQWADDRSIQICDPPYDRTPGSRVEIPRYVSHPAIPDAVWPQVLDRARRLAARFGATGSEVFADQPGNHTVRFYSPEGTEVFIGSRGAVIAGNTGCRLPAESMPSSAPTR